MRLRDSWDWLAVVTACAVVIIVLLAAAVRRAGTAERAAAELAARYAQAADCSEAMDEAIAAARLAGRATWNEQMQAQALRSLAWSSIYANVGCP